MRPQQCVHCPDTAMVASPLVVIAPVMRQENIRLIHVATDERIQIHTGQRWAEQHVTWIILPCALYGVKYIDLVAPMTHRAALGKAARFSAAFGQHIQYCKVYA